jgi:hypothetical protein
LLINNYLTPQPEKKNPSKLQRINFGKIYTRFINYRKPGVIKSQGKIGAGKRKDLLLNIYFSKTKPYKLSIRIPSKIKTKKFNWQLKKQKEYIKIVDIKYAPSINKKPYSVYPKIISDTPYLYRGKVYYNFDIHIRKIGLYFIKVKAGYHDNFIYMPINITAVLRKVDIPTLRNLITTYFTLLRNINNVLMYKNYDSSFSSSEQEKISKYIDELNIIKLKVRMLSEIEKEKFRKEIMNHPQTRLFIKNIKRLKIPLGK